MREDQRSVAACIQPIPGAIEPTGLVISASGGIAGAVVAGA